MARFCSIVHDGAQIVSVTVEDTRPQKLKDYSGTDREVFEKTCPDPFIDSSETTLSCAIKSDKKVQLFRSTEDLSLEILISGENKPPTNELAIRMADEFQSPYPPDVIR